VCGRSPDRAISGTGDNSNGTNVIFDPKQYKERPGLLQVGGTIYTTWSSHCDIRPYTSWVMAFSADTLGRPASSISFQRQRRRHLDGRNRASRRSRRQFIFHHRQRRFRHNSGQQRLSGKRKLRQLLRQALDQAAELRLADYFTPHNTVSESNADQDFGSGGGMLIVDVVDAGGQTRHLSVGAGKDSLIYVVDRDANGQVQFHHRSDLSGDFRAIGRRSFLDAGLFQ